MNEEKLQAAINKARMAKALQDNEFLQECFAAIEAKYIKEWKSSADERLRDILWRNLNGLGIFKDHLTNLIVNGTHAERELNQQ